MNSKNLKEQDSQSKKNRHASFAPDPNSILNLSPILQKGLKKDQKINPLAIDKKTVSQSASPEHKKNSKAINNVKEELISASLSPSKTKSAYVANNGKQPFSLNQINLQNISNEDFKSSYDDLVPTFEERNISGREPSHTVYSSRKSKKPYPRRSIDFFQKAESTPLPLIKEISQINFPNYNINDFVIIDELGRGGCGKVYRAFDHKTRRLLAVKEQIINNNEEMDDLIYEDKILTTIQQFNNYNYIKYYGLFKDPNSKSFFMEMETGVVDLYKMNYHRHLINNNYSKSELLFILKSLLKDFAYLEEKGISHCDVKPQNVILIEKLGQIVYKISDFGLSRILKPNVKFINCEEMMGYSQLYVSPEILEIDKDTNKFNEYDPFLSDVYSLGILAITLMNKKKDEFLISYDESDFLNSLIISMINDDPLKRPRFAEILNKINFEKNLKIEEPIDERIILDSLKINKEILVPKDKTYYVIEVFLVEIDRLFHEDYVDQSEDKLNELLKQPNIGEMLKKNLNLQYRVWIYTGDIMCIKNKNFDKAEYNYQLPYNKIRNASESYDLSLLFHIEGRLIILYDLLALYSNGIESNNYFVRADTIIFDINCRFKKYRERNPDLIWENIEKLQEIIKTHENIKIGAGKSKKNKDEIRKEFENNFKYCFSSLEKKIKINLRERKKLRKPDF